MWLRLALALVLVAPVLAALYEYEDGGTTFEWLHGILSGMGLSVGVAASILTVCGLRACTNGALRDMFACTERWKGLLALLCDDVTRALERLRPADEGWECLTM